MDSILCAIGDLNQIYEVRNALGKNDGPFLEKLTPHVLPEKCNYISGHKDGSEWRLIAALCDKTVRIFSLCPSHSLKELCRLPFPRGLSLTDIGRMVSFPGNSLCILYETMSRQTSLGYWALWIYATDEKGSFGYPKCLLEGKFTPFGAFDLCTTLGQGISLVTRDVLTNDLHIFKIDGLRMLRNTRISEGKSINYCIQCRKS